MAQHTRLKVDAGVQVYLCDPQSSRQHGTNENTNGLLRQYFPKRTDLSARRAETGAVVAATLMAGRIKVLGWRTPAEVLDQRLAQIEPRVATTGCVRPLTGTACTQHPGISPQQAEQRMTG